MTNKGGRDHLSRLFLRMKKTLDRSERDISWHFGGRRFFEKHTCELIKSHRWCFIAGCNNSGTTLLKNLLRDTDQFSAFSSEGQVITDTLGKAERRGYERVWTEFLSEIRMTPADNRVNVPRLLHDWMNKMESPYHDVVLEKATLNAVRMSWLQKVFPRSYFIGLVRNGYAVTESISRRGNKSVERSARHWAKANEIMLEDAGGLDRYLQVRYEEMARDPEAVLRRVGDFLSLDLVVNDAVLERIKTVEDQDAKSIGRLSTSDVERIEKEAGSMLKLLDYCPAAAVDQPVPAREDIKKAVNCSDL